MKAAIMPDKVDTAQSLGNKNVGQNLDIAGQPKVPQSSLRKLLASDDVGREQKLKDGQNMVKITVLDSDGEDEENAGGKSVMTRMAKMALLEEGGEDEENGGGESVMARMAKMVVLEEEREEERVGGDKPLMTDEEFLEFLKTRGGEQRLQKGGQLPWEMQGVFSELQKVSKFLAYLFLLLLLKTCSFISL